MWLDYVEGQALRLKEVFLKDWAEKLDAFLTFNERQVLEGGARCRINKPQRMPKRNMSSSPPSGERCWSTKGPSSICALWKKRPKPCPSPQKGEATAHPVNFTRFEAAYQALTNKLRPQVFSLGFYADVASNLASRVLLSIS